MHFIFSKFYIFLDDEGSIIPEFQGQSNFWKNKPYSSHFAYVPYGKNKMIEMIEMLKKSLIICQL